MNMTITSYGTRRASYWNQFKSQFAEWRRRSHSRHELQFLSDQTLRDIGLTSMRGPPRSHQAVLDGLNWLL